MHEHSSDHKGANCRAMVDVYSKMKPDSFKSQLQTVLTAYYEDINGVQGASGCPKTITRLSNASSRTKRRPEQCLTRTPPPTLLPTLPPPPSRRTGAQQPPLTGWSLLAPPCPATSPGGTGKGKLVAWGGRKNARS